MVASGNQSNESTSTMRDRAHNVAGRVAEKVQEAASQITGTGSGQGGVSSGGGGDREQQTPVTEKAKEQVSSRLDMGKEYLVDSVTGVAQALRQTGQHMRQEGSQPMLAQYADRGAEQIENFGGYLRRRDTSEIVADVEGFARRQPMVFAGGAFMLGMLAVRFFRSNSQPQSQSQWASSPTANTRGSLATSTPPLTGRTGSAAIPGSAPAIPSSRPSEAQPAGGRTPTSSPSSSPGTGTNTGTRTAPGTAAPTPGSVSERPMPNPATRPSTGASTSGSGTATPRPEPGTRPAGGTPNPERPGTGGRNQP